MQTLAASDFAAKTISTPSYQTPGLGSFTITSADAVLAENVTSGAASPTVGEIDMRRRPAQERMAALIAEARLAVDQWHGDWAGAPFTEEALEIVPVGRSK